MPLLIIGTDTDIGKTTIAAWLCLHLGAAYFKPIQSGSRLHSDTACVADWSRAKTYPENFCLQEPLSPHAAAAIDGITIELSKIALPKDSNLIVEGAGGLMVPLAPGILQLELFARWNLPTVIVAKSGLGTLNHTLMTVDILRRHGQNIVGVILNGPPNESNQEAIETFGQVPVLTTFPPLETISYETLAATPLPTKAASLFRQHL